MKGVVDVVNAYMKTHELRLACAGTKLLISGANEPLEDPLSCSLAEHFFRRSIVAISITQPLDLRSATSFIQALGQKPETLKERGGLRPELTRLHVAGVDVFEVDFSLLFSGQVNALGTVDAFTQKALDILLQADNSTDKAGYVVNIPTSQLLTAEHLSAFVDDLFLVAPKDLLSVKAAQARSVSQKQSSMSKEAFQNTTAETLGDVVFKAYEATCQPLKESNASEEKYLATAGALVNAVNQLAPTARFHVLKKLAQEQEAAHVEGKETSGTLPHIRDELLTESILTSFSRYGSTLEMMVAAGTVIRFLRTTVNERKKLVEWLDTHLRALSQPLGAVPWQELIAYVSDNPQYGLLTFEPNTVRAGLIEMAMARRNSEKVSPETQRLLRSIEASAVREKVDGLLRVVLRKDKTLSGAMGLRAKDVIESADFEGAHVDAEALKLLLALVDEASKENQAGANTQALVELFKGQKGAARLVQVLKDQSMRLHPVMIDAYVAAVEANTKPAIKRELADASQRLPSEWARKLLSRAPTAGAQALYFIVRGAASAEPQLALEAARQGLRHERFEVKTMAMRALSYLGRREALAMLTQAAGVDSDDTTKRVLRLEHLAMNEDQLYDLQKVAVEALGQTKIEAAVAPLEAILTRKRLFTSRAVELLRADAAQALAANATETAIQILQKGKESPNKAVRDVCLRVL